MSRKRTADEISREQHTRLVSLWRCVLQQQIQDGKSKAKGVSQRKWRDEARAYLFSPKYEDDLRAVCDMAEWSVAYIRRIALQAGAVPPKTPRILPKKQPTQPLLFRLPESTCRPKKRAYNRQKGVLNIYTQPYISNLQHSTHV